MIDTERVYNEDTQEYTETTDDTQQEQQEEQVEQPEEQEVGQDEPQKQENEGQRNFRQVRESLEKERQERERERQERLRAERERDEAFNILRDLERRALEAKNPNKSAEDEFIDDDAKKLHREIQQLKQIQEQQRQQQYQEQVERRLRREYPQFDELMTEENIAAFARSNPRRASILQKEKDLYLQASETIEGILEMRTKQEPYLQDRAKLLQNAKKPKVTNPVPAQQSSSPLVNLASAGRISSTDLDRIREVTQGFINKRVAE